MPTTEAMAIGRPKHRHKFFASESRAAAAAYARRMHVVDPSGRWQALGLCECGVYPIVHLRRRSGGAVVPMRRAA